VNFKTISLIMGHVKIVVAFMDVPGFTFLWFDIHRMILGHENFPPFVNAGTLLFVYWYIMQPSVLQVAYYQVIRILLLLTENTSAASVLICCNFYHMLNIK
jgi:hypothetical protein